MSSARITASAASRPRNTFGSGSSSSGAPPPAVRGGAAPSRSTATGPSSTKTNSAALGGKGNFYQNIKSLRNSGVGRPSAAAGGVRRPSPSSSARGVGMAPPPRRPSVLPFPEADSFISQPAPGWVQNSGTGQGSSSISQPAVGAVGGAKVPEAADPPLPLLAETKKVEKQIQIVDQKAAKRTKNTEQVLIAFIEKQMGPTAAAALKADFDAEKSKSPSDERPAKKTRFSEQAYGVTYIPETERIKGRAEGVALVANEATVGGGRGDGRGCGCGRG